MNDGGKGSKRRPTNEEAYRSSWDTIFGKVKKGSSDTHHAPSAAPVTLEHSMKVEAVSALAVSPTVGEQGK